MEEINPFLDEDGKLVLSAFLPKKARWRTAGGIARESGLTEIEVVQFIGDNQDWFVTSDIKPGGRSLWGIRPDLLRSISRSTRTLQQAAGGQ